MTIFKHRKDLRQDWPEGVPARSMPYREGMQAARTWHEAGKPRGELAACPYMQGSVEFDAWFAGLEAGHRQFDQRNSESFVQGGEK